MPWAGIGNEIKIGPVTFWDYYRQADEKIQDKELRETLDKILACYVGKSGKSVTTIAMLSHGAPDFRVLGDAGREEIQRAVDAHTFSIIYPNTADGIRLKRWDMAPPSSERYQFYLQSFTPGNKYVSVRAGVSTDIWPIKDLRLNQPWGLGGFASRPDDDLIEAFGRVLDPTFPEDDRRRIFRSLEWFRMAHSQSDSVHALAKVVHMATAFETLLQVGRKKEKAKFIRKKVEERFREKDSITETRMELSPPIKGPPRVDVPVILTKAAWWAQDFYDMRSDITHGDYIEPARMRFTLPGTKKTLSQLDVAAVVFGEMLLWELEERKLCGPVVDDFNMGVRGISGTNDDGCRHRRETVPISPLGGGPLNDLLPV